LEIIIAEPIGYCYGVERALNITYEALKSKSDNIYTIGPIIHNPQVVKKLKDNGIKIIENLENVDIGTLIIRAHGIDPKKLERARKMGFKVIDATCPFVKKNQKRATQLVKEGYFLVVIGEKEHPEILGILANANGPFIVIENKSDYKKLPDVKRVGVITQTTQSMENFISVVSYLLEKYKEIKIFNTICDETIERQKSARNIANKVDLMLVVGGKNSANTKRLAEIGKSINENTYHIETSEEIIKKWLKGVKKVGISGGASTPKWLIDEAIKKIKKITSH